jgi:hypothetical protein
VNFIVSSSHSESAVAWRHASDLGVVEDLHHDDVAGRHAEVDADRVRVLEIDHHDVTRSSMRLAQMHVIANIVVVNGNPQLFGNPDKTSPDQGSASECN